jgi:hypothetical protein
MGRLSLLVRTTATCALVFAIVAGPSSAETRMCANTYGGDVISAKNMRCWKARDIVRTWAVRYARDGRVNRRVRRFRCRDRSNSIEGLVVKCRRGDKRVRFYANVPW